MALLRARHRRDQRDSIAACLAYVLPLALDLHNPMDDQLVQWLILSAIAIAALLIGVAVGYREGKRIGVLTRSERFNRLPSLLRLNGTEWQVEFTEFGPFGTQQHSGGMTFRQYDSRVIGSGADDAGHAWTAEGVVYGDKLCYVVLDTDADGLSLGTVMVDHRPETGVLEGMRCVWSPEQNAVSVQPIRLSCVGESPQSEAAEPHRELVTSDDMC